ncbi:MAG: FAD-dependent oxidoreductase, partial [Phycisphaerae bacterium]
GASDSLFADRVLVTVPLGVLKSGMIRFTPRLPDEKLATATLTAANPRPGAETTTCKLEIRPAFTHGNIEDEAVFKVKIDYLYAKPITIDVNRGSNSTVTLYPGIPTEFSYKFKSSPSPAPKGASRIGTLRAIERRSKNSVIEIEIREK